MAKVVEKNRVKKAAKKAAPKRAIKKTSKKGTVSKKAAAKKSVRRTADYLTKEVLVRAARKGFTAAATRTMQVMGENVIVRGGWVVAKRKDGTIHRIARIANAPALELD